MWLCFSDAFLSVVRDKDDFEVLKVRARKRAHLATHFPHHRILRDDRADYRYRVIASRHDVTRLLIRSIASLDYTNFKNSVKDRELHDLYALWWGDHRAYQEKPEARKRDKKRQLFPPPGAKVIAPKL